MVNQPQAWSSLSGEELAKTLQQAAVLPKSDSISAAVVDGEVRVTIGLDRPNEEMDQDCKIDAALLAHAAVNADNSIVRVKVRFIDLRRRTARQVTVKSGDLTAFAGANMDKEQLLKSLEVQQVVFTVAWTEVITYALTLGKDSQVSVSLAGDQAIISTYAYMLRDEDRKPAALSMAESLFAADPTLNSIKVCFYQKDAKTYRSVLVKSEDIRSLHSSSLTKDTMLEKLLVEEVVTPVKTASTSKPEESTTEKDFPIATAAGVAFRYPAKNWILRTYPKNEELLTLVSTMFDKADKIELDMYRQPASLLAVAQKVEEPWRQMNDSRVLSNKQTRFGAGKAIGGLDWLFNYFSAGPQFPEYHYYVRHVYFGFPGQVYCLHMHSNIKNYSSINADFERILDTLTIATPHPAPAHGVTVPYAKPKTK